LIFIFDVLLLRPARDRRTTARPETRLVESARGKQKIREGANVRPEEESALADAERLGRARAKDADAPIPDPRPPKDLSTIAIRAPRIIIGDAVFARLCGTLVIRTSSGIATEAYAHSYFPF
jgi:hypothetical protein